MNGIAITFHGTLATDCAVMPFGEAPMPDANVEFLNAKNATPTRTKILVVDDDEMVRFSLSLALEANDFEVVIAGSVNEALQHIAAQTFDVLLSDLHMPNSGDGLTVVSAMRHSNPRAITLIFSGYPEMKEAAAAILLQADEIWTKPLPIEKLVRKIRERMKQGPTPGRVVENVATILEQETQTTIKDWLLHVELEPEIITVSLDYKARCAHLPQLFRDLIYRLRYPQPLGSRALVSPAAAEHGLLRRKQGYTAAMMVEESRMLQVSIFQALQNNLHKVDYSVLLVGVMAIADEVDSQLAQQMASYISESNVDLLPVDA